MFVDLAIGSPRPLRGAISWGPSVLGAFSRVPVSTSSPCPAGVKRYRRLGVRLATRLSRADAYHGGTGTVLLWSPGPTFEPHECSPGQDTLEVAAGVVRPVPWGWRTVASASADGAGPSRTSSGRPSSSAYPRQRRWQPSGLPIAAPDTRLGRQEGGGLLALPVACNVVVLEGDPHPVRLAPTPVSTTGAHHDSSLVAQRSRHPQARGHQHRPLHLSGHHRR